MPRKTKDLKEQEIEVKTSNTKKATKATVTKKVAQKKETSTSKKTNTVKKSTTLKKDDKKSSTSKTTKKTSPVKQTTTSKRATTKKASVTKKSTSKKVISRKKVDIVEYYDLPYRYNQTIVKLLAQTPTNLFIYWDISDEDRENYKKQYGENFFETTKPVLKIFNDTMNYNFEVEINDFANSWYLHVNDSKCDYRIELGRRPIYNPSDIGGTEYVYISTSNEIESPNDKILFDKMQNMVYFKNVKTNSTKSKSVANLSFIRNMGKIYNIYDLYKQIYKDEDIENTYNPSSRFF